MIHFVSLIYLKISFVTETLKSRYQIFFYPFILYPLVCPTRQLACPSATVKEQTSARVLPVNCFSPADDQAKKTMYFRFTDYIFVCIVNGKKTLTMYVIAF